ANDILDNFKTIFSPEELRNLRDEETLCLALGGKLKLTLELTPASIADSLATAAQEVLGRALGVTMAASTALKITVLFHVDGGYRIFAQRGSAGQSVKFSVRKTSSRIIGVDGSVGIAAMLKDPAQLLKPIANVVTKITGLPGALVDKAVAAIPSGNLSPEEM